MWDRSSLRTRWSAIGAAVAVTLGAGGIGLVSATSPADAVTFIPITPCRVIDTRPAPDTVGPKASPLGGGETHDVTAVGASGDCTDVPADASAVSLNVTAIGATLPTFLTVWKAGATQPEASSLNPVPGAPPTPNAVTTELSAAGEFSIFNLQGNVDVLADINGYYVDHHHDDRYYTKAQTDAAVAGSGRTIPLTALEFERLDGQWFRQQNTDPSTGRDYTNLIHGASDFGECASVPLPVDVGGRVIGIEISYIALFNVPTFAVFIEGVDPAAVPLIVPLAVTVDGIMTSGRSVVEVPLAGPIVIGDYFPVLTLCTDDPVRVYGVTVDLD